MCINLTAYKWLENNVDKPDKKNKRGDKSHSLNYACGSVVVFRSCQYNQSRNSVSLPDRQDHLFSSEVRGIPMTCDFMNY